MLEAQARCPHLGHAHDDLDVLMVPAHFGVVIEVDVSEHEGPVRGIAPDAADELGHQPGPPLLQELVVDRLVEMAEHIHVSPAQLHAQTVFESRRHGRVV